MNEEMFKSLMGLYNDAVFKKSFLAFFTKMQEEGMEAAKRFWDVSPEKSAFSFDPTDMFEKMASFYENLGFVPKAKYDKVVNENKRLKEKIEFLENTIKEMNLKVFTEGSEKAQEMWKDVVEKQMDAAKEFSKNFFDIFKPYEDKNDKE